MEINAKTVKNPLTIIAIFAGLSEISGTIVLPFVNKDLQSIFIWFLIIFPILLVLLFFYVLIFRHEVLYAPSDFSSDDYFYKLAQRASPATSKEISKKIEDDVIEISGEIEKPKSKKKVNVELYENIIKNPSLTYFVAEELAIKKLKLDYSNNIQRQIALDFNNNRYVFDGVLIEKNRFELFEIKYFPREKTPLNGIGKSFNYFKEAYNNYTKEKGRPLKVIFVIVTPVEASKHEKMKSNVKRILKDSPFEYEIIMYNYSDLEQEFGINR